jgi:hypothetical protein
MDLKRYFKGKDGSGVLSTANSKGVVNAAIYALPHVIDVDRVVFIMADKLSRANIQQNPHAVYLFKEDGPGYKGVRIYLKAQAEFKDEDFVKQVCDIAYPGPYCNAKALKGSSLLSFKVTKVIPLVGDGAKKA